jgi:hypothetical protein
MLLVESSFVDGPAAARVTLARRRDSMTALPVAAISSSWPVMI